MFDRLYQAERSSTAPGASLNQLWAISIPEK